MPNNIGNIRSLSRIDRIGGGGVSQDILPRAYLFDGVNDYIAGDTTIGRTGYDLNVAGNVTTGSDSDGSYIQFTGATSGLLTGTALSHVSLASAFTVTFYFKTGADVATTQRIFNNTVSSSNRIAFAIISGDLRCGIYNGTSYVGKKAVGVSANTLYKCTYTWDGSSVGKLYVNNVEETTVPAGDPTGTATVSVFIGGPTANFFTGFVYFLRAYNKELSNTERDAEYANGMTSLVGYTGTDIPISNLLAEYRPENLQYNTQYVASPKNLTGYTKGSGTTVTADTTVAPDGTTTADQVAWTGVGLATSSCYCPPITTISGSTLASKTFIVKAFVKVAAGTAAFRLRIAHRGVADYYSSNQTATTTRQEFTFTQAFTSSSSGTGIDGGVVTDTTFTAATLEVWNVRLFLTNETLRDESPNIGNFIGRKTNKVVSFWCKPGTDGNSASTSQPLTRLPRLVSYIGGTTNTLIVRYDNRLGAQSTTGTALGNGFRGKVHFIVTYERLSASSVRRLRIYKDGVLDKSQNKQVDTPSSIGGTGDTLARLGIHPSLTYYTGHARDARIYTGTIDDTDATNMYNGGEPATAVKYLQRKPNSAEGGTTARDRSGNLRTGTLTGGVTRVAVPAS